MNSYKLDYSVRASMIDAAGIVRVNGEKHCTSQMAHSILDQLYDVVAPWLPEYCYLSLTGKVVVLPRKDISSSPSDEHMIELHIDGKAPYVATLITADNVIICGDGWKRGAKAIDDNTEQLTDVQTEIILYNINEGYEYAGSVEAYPEFNEPKFSWRILDIERYEDVVNNAVTVE